MADIYVVDRLGPTQSLTEEGYLLCKDVPLARTGVMIYGPWELKDEGGNYLKPGGDGVIYVNRSPEELFNEKTMGSFEGKPVTINHPAVAGFMVSPENHGDLAKGFARNIHRGIGADTDILFGDILITNTEGIKKVRTGELRQISLGYNASYAQEAPGVAKQYDILGNHIALVVSGRCGERCAIGDSNMKTKTLDELTKVKLRQAFMTRDADAFEDLMGKPEEKKPEGGPEEKKPEEGSGGPPPFAKKEEGGEGGEGKPPPSAPPPGAAEGGTHHHIVINVHGQGAGGVPGATGGASGVDVQQDPAANGAGVPQIGPADEGGATRVGADPNDPGGAGGAMGDPNADDGDPVEMIMAAIKKLAARITALEQRAGGGAQQQPQPQAQAPAPKPEGGGEKPPTQDDGEAGGTDMSGSIAVEHKAETSKVDQEAGLAPSGTKPEAEGPKGADGPQLEKDMIIKGGEEGGEKGPPGAPEGATKDDAETPSGAPGPELEKDMVTKDDAVAPAGTPGPDLAKGAGIKTRDRIRTKDGVLDAKKAVREREAWQQAMAMAEVLSPGCKLPTFDAALPTADAKNNLCNFKRGVLGNAWKSTEGQSAMRLFTGDEEPKITSMTCDAVDILFTAAGRTVANNHDMLSVHRGGSVAKQATPGETKVPTPAELNAMYKEHFKDQI